MPSDRARITYDPYRGYRSVVVQQGRVTLEADSNEQATLESEALRLETIDVVGVEGTPDNGYLVAAGPGGTGVVVGAGTLYAGGWRLTLPSAVSLGQQPDWLDNPSPGLPDGNSVIALLVTEQTITAIEDQALREVALGGPDTAARTRLMQQFLAIPTQDDTCAAAAKDITQLPQFAGLSLDPTTLELTSTATLLVNPFNPTAPTDPCCPPASGGYLGTDNQLVRVTVTSFDAATNSGTLLWGWNNASFLYRASLVSPTASPQVLTLAPNPMDAEHTPQPTQAIEILRTCCVLGGPANKNYVASREGEVIAPLTSNPTIFQSPNQLTLPTGYSLPSGYQTEPNSLFVRIWQGTVPFNSGVPQLLDPVSGITVTVNMTALPSGPFAMRPVWEFAVRPNTPQLVYPQRYLDHAQPPNEPRQWLCDLAIVSAEENGTNVSVLANCITSFLPLTGQTQEGGCCGITLGPADVTAMGGMQAVVDAQAGSSLSLKPGTYTLEAPLALTEKHSGLTFCGCGPGVILSADPQAISAFAPGLITVRGGKNITLGSLVLELPAVQVQISAQDAAANAAAGITLPQVNTMIGIRAATFSGLTIEACEFRYALPAPATSGQSAVLAAGIFLQGSCSGLQVLRSAFVCGAGSSESATVVNLLLGIWISPSAQVDNLNTFLAGSTLQQVDGATPVKHTLDDAEILCNTFSGLTIAAVVYALLGHIKCNENRVSKCFGGLWFVDADLGGLAAFLRQALDAQKSTSTTPGALKAYLEILLDGSEATFLSTLVWSAGVLAYFAAANNAVWIPYSSALESVSDEVKGIVVTDYTTLGTERYQAFTANFPAQAATDPGTAGAPEQAAPAEAAQPPDQVTTQVDDAYLTKMTNALNTMQTVSVASTLAGRTSETIVAVRDNDIELISVPNIGDDSSKTAGGSFTGLLAIYSSNAETGNQGGEKPDPTLGSAPIAALFVTGNRVQGPNIRSIALGTIWEADTVITGNLFRQIGSVPIPWQRQEEEPSVPCAFTIQSDPRQLAITGNLVHTTWIIVPLPRMHTYTGALNDWYFLNSVG